jgi:hypothetical protein
LCILLIALIFLNQYKIHHNQDLSYGRLLALHTTLKNELHEVAKKWPPNSQVVVLTDTSHNTQTSGFNHWSTWYLRYLANRYDIIGLFGPLPAISQQPFVNQYRDHDPEYWEIINNRSRRIPMVGLEKSRPTFFYKINGGKLIPFKGAIFEIGGVHVVRNGESFERSLKNHNTIDINGFLDWNKKQIIQKTSINNKPTPAPIYAPQFTQKSNNTWHYQHDEKAKQRLWIQSFDRPTKSGEKVDASIILSSDRRMVVSASLARHDTNEPYEGSAKNIILEPGVETPVELFHTFKIPRKTLKIQLDIKECDGHTATMEIKNIVLNPAQ